MENETMNQLRKASRRGEDETRRGLFMPREGIPLPTIGSYMSVMSVLRTVRQPHFMSNTEVALVDRNNQLIVLKEFSAEPNAAEKGIVEFILAGLEKKEGNENHLFVRRQGVCRRRHTPQEDLPVDVSKLVIYTGMDKISEMQKSINLILLAVSILAALV